MFKKILVAIDGSENSHKAVVYAIELAEKFGGVIDAVHVVEDTSAIIDTPQESNPLKYQNLNEPRVQAVFELLEQSDIIYGIHILRGDPAQTIIDFVHQRACNCVVIGSRGLHPIKSIFLGSVSQKVAKHIECPVLIVK